MYVLESECLLIVNIFIEKEEKTSARVSSQKTEAGKPRERVGAINYGNTHN